ncbi:MAG: hypothetical protein [Caudoviricetes sp.]|nr:MAG: hypothetical protein [Caudoviricetes sp.]
MHLRRGVYGHQHIALRHRHARRLYGCAGLPHDPAALNIRALIVPLVLNLKPRVFNSRKNMRSGKFSAMNARVVGFQICSLERLALLIDMLTHCLPPIPFSVEFLTS